MEDALVSIVVPVYQVETYLDACVSSLLAQSYPHIEILLVDDGSTDRSPALCEAWAERDARVRVLHQRNGGLSAARNTGIEAARGDWLVLVDSDDRVAVDFVAQLLCAAQTAHADMAVCSFVYDYGETREPLHPVIREEQATFTGQELTQEYFSLRAVEFTVAWNKIYRRELFAGVRYPERRLHEDEFTTYRLIYRAKRVAWLSAPLYYYRQRPGSIMASYRAQNVADTMAFYAKYFRWCDDYAPELRPAVEHAALLGYLGLLERVHATPSLAAKLTTRGAMAAFRRLLRENVHGYLKNPYTSKKEQVKYLLWRAGLYLAIKRVWQWGKMHMIGNQDHA